MSLGQSRRTIALRLALGILLAALLSGLLCLALEVAGFPARMYLRRALPGSRTDRASLGSGPLTFYVDGANGNDADNGLSSQSAWRTIQKAANSVAAGDTVTVLPATYDERVRITVSGSAQAPITFQAQGTASTKGFTIQADFVVLRGFEIAHADGAGNAGYGIYVEGSNCVIEGNYVHDALQGGIAVYAPVGQESLAAHNTIRANRLYRNSQVGINVAGSSNLVEDNEVWATLQFHPNLPTRPPWADADGIRFFGSAHTLRRNYIHDISYRDPENVNPHIDCFQTWADSSHSPATNVTIEANLCVALESQAPNETGHAIMLRNSRDLLVRNNLFLASGIIETGGGDNSYLTVVNNTFASDLSFPFTGGVNLVDCPNSTVHNNIFYNFPSNYIGALRVAGTSSSGLSAGYNLYFRSDGGSTRAPTFPGDLRQADPLFTDALNGDFRLSQGSPAIDAGASLPNLVSLDYSGLSRPQGNATDIGAFEFSANTATTAPTG